MRWSARKLSAPAVLRTKIRLMGGFDFPTDLGSHPDWVKVGYENRRAAGGDLEGRAAGKAPTFVVWAQRDPDTRRWPACRSSRAGRTASRPAR